MFYCCSTFVLSTLNIIGDKIIFLKRVYIYLRNRKHFRCFHTVIETRVEVWENEKLKWEHEDKGDDEFFLISILEYLNPR